MRRAVVALALAGIVAGGILVIRWTTAPAPSSGPLLVLAAASLTEVLPALDGRARYSFGGSDQLAQQLRMGAPADVFLSASPRYTRKLFAEALVGTPVEFATNRLVLLVPRANPARIRVAGDISRPGVRLVVAAENVPAGAYALEALRRLSLRRSLANVVSREPDVKAVAAKVALGEADAGFVYATDVGPVASRVRVIPLPRRASPVARYEAAVSSSSPRLAAARAFVARLLSPRGRARLAAAGFGAP